MKAQVTREEQSVTIAAGLGVLLGVLAAGALVLATVGAFLDTSEPFDAGLPWVIALSVLCCGVYLVRQRRASGREAKWAAVHDGANNFPPRRMTAHHPGPGASRATAFRPDVVFRIAVLVLVAVFTVLTLHRRSETTH